LELKELSLKEFKENLEKLMKEPKLKLKDLKNKKDNNNKFKELDFNSNY
jgi:hypothetical protein